ncbi:hypothetical protein QE152_g29657 [Popillia japonica]|uniref:Uncharacterized protein n=1 Tax=Popillia japonica TaxID=7064 RepID=A0AAW1JHB7_POPJA
MSDPIAERNSAGTVHVLIINPATRFMQKCAVVKMQILLEKLNYTYKSKLLLVILGTFSRKISCVRITVYIYDTLSYIWRRITNIGNLEAESKINKP